MPQFRVTGPDGTAYDVTAPDGASPSDVMAMVQQQHQANHNQIAAQVASDPISQGARDFNSGTGDFQNAVAGYGKAGVDLARGAGQWLGMVDRGDVAESRRLDAPLMKTKAGMAGNITGNVMNLAPAALIPGAGTVAGGAAIGATTGLIQPSTSTQETLLNTGIGAAAGGAVPLLQRLWRVAKASAEPLYQAGQEAIVGRTLNAAAGQEAPQVANRLANAGAPLVGPQLPGVQRTVAGELVPGSIPTVGQAAENAGVASLERAASANNPAVTNAISDTMKAQNAARAGALNEVAGDATSRASAEGTRLAAARPLYDQAKAAFMPNDKELAAVMGRLPNGVLARAQNLARMNGEALQVGKDLPPSVVAATDAAGIPILQDAAAQTSNFSGKGLHYIKMALDDAIGKTGDGAMGEAEKRAAVAVKEALLAKLDSGLPGYAAARSKFAELSRPINQMDVGAAIANKSVSPLNGNLQPAAYAKALSDKTAQQATGFSGATLENTMAPTQLNALNNILQDVQRSTAAQNAGRGVGSDTVQKLAYTNLMDQSGLPTFVRDFKPAQIVGNIAGRGADAVYARANREIGNRLAEVMMDPAQAAALMRRVTPAQRNQLLELLSASASGLALSAPASANALQH